MSHDSGDQKQLFQRDENQRKNFTRAKTKIAQYFIESKNIFNPLFYNNMKKIG